MLAALLPAQSDAIVRVLGEMAEALGVVDEIAVHEVARTGFLRSQAEDPATYERTEAAILRQAARRAQAGSPIRFTTLAVSDSDVLSIVSQLPLAPEQAFAVGVTERVRRRFRLGTRLMLRMMCDLFARPCGANLEKRLGEGGACGGLNDE